MDGIKDAIVPITFLDDVEYNSDNDKKHFMANLNELFTNPYDINTVYRPITIVEPTDRILNAYNDAIKRSKVAYIQMNVEDLVVNTMIEMISDITENSPYVKVDLIKLMNSNFIHNMYVHNIIESELQDIEYIDITMCNLYTRIVKDIIDPFIVVITTSILDNSTVCRDIYEHYVDTEPSSFEKVYNAFGNTTYCNISVLIRDIAEVKMSNVRRLFDVIKQTYLNMGQFSSDYHIDPVSKSIVSNNDSYYNYLRETKFDIGGNDDV